MRFLMHTQLLAFVKRNTECDKHTWRRMRVMKLKDARRKEGGGVVVVRLYVPF
jgi:hypothetical protein